MKRFPINQDAPKEWKMWICAKENKMKTPEELADEEISKVENIQSAMTEDWQTFCKRMFLAGFAAANRWISVEEELPDQGVAVLAIRAIPPKKICSPLLGPNYFTDRYPCIVNGTYIHQERQFPEDSNINVTHWQPLPPLPNK